MRHYVADRCGVQSQKCHDDSHWVRTACVPFKVLLLLFARGQSCIWPVRRGLRSVTPCALVLGGGVLPGTGTPGSPWPPFAAPKTASPRRGKRTGGSARGRGWGTMAEPKSATPAPRAVRGCPQTQKRIWGGLEGASPAQEGRGSAVRCPGLFPASMS
jgi:hypothetical protein